MMKISPKLICLAELMWKKEPIAAEELVQMCGEEFSWSKPKAYAVLHKLCKCGIARKHEGTVYALISKEECWAKWSKQYGDENYHGAVQDYLNATTRVGFFEGGASSFSKRYN